METFFHNDPRIEEWIGQITEKIFTVCLLTGVDSEAEFQRGCKLVKKVTSVLQGISSFPLEYLEDALKQLLEQQLPDARVINNFPEFRNIMDRMLSEGMLKAIDIQTKETIKTLAFPNEIAQGGESNEPNSERLLGDICEDFVPDRVVPALASPKVKTQDIRKSNTEIMDFEPIPTDTKKLKVTHKVPEQAERLKYVLKSIFPNAIVQWNVTIMGQAFLAQVEDILICLHDPECPCIITKFNKEGWKVIVFNAEDLIFPRRLERGIKQVQRSKNGLA